MKKHVILAGLLACMGISLQAQESKPEEPKGKTIVQVFGNFNSEFDTDNCNYGFELERSYLGYEYKLENGLSMKAVMDVGKSSNVDDYHRLAYIKNAMLSWKTGGLTLNGGLISTTQFNFQEKFWGYRYIMKSFQDQYTFGSSADLGISAAYKFNDRISADAIIVNGEGYKKIQQNNGLNYGLGLTVNPISNFYVRLYGGLNTSDEIEDKNIANIATFAGYKSDKFTMGVEYNYMQNSSFDSNADKDGYSIFTSVKLSKTTELYARFDELSSKNELNSAKDESAAIVGAQFKLGKYVKIAPNFRISMPKAEGAENYCSAYISCYFGL